MEHKKNEIKVSAPSSTIGLHVSTTNTKQVISATNNRAQYYADLAKKYRDEAKQHRDNAKYYAEQNSDVTVEYILEVKADVLNKMNEQKKEIESDFETKLPKNLSELNNDIPYISSSDLELVTNDLENKDNETLEIIENISNDTLNKSQITNCLLEAPQNIKLELNNGTLTLKAGSKVIVPKGAGMFDEVVITSDMVFKNTALGNREAYIVIRTNPLDIQIPPVLSCSSGTSMPSAGWYYNTTENKIYRDGLFEGASLPIAKVTYVNGSGVVSIDETFNDMGYFGSTIFANKDIKGLIPDGRNADGTLNNRELNSPAVRTVNVGKNQTNFSLVLNNEGLYILGPFNYVASGPTPLAAGVCYVEATNKLYNNGGQRWWVYIASFSTDANGRITSLKTKLSFRAVDYNDALLKSDKSEIVSWGMPDYSAGISVDITTSDKSFTAPCDGLYVTMPYTDGLNYLIVNGVATVYGYQDTSSGEHVEGVTIPLGKNDVIKWQKNLYSSKTYYSTFFPLKGAN